jgi:hypothetical protein
MVIDNADDVTVFLETGRDQSRCLHGAVLITTRHKSVSVDTCHEVRGRINVPAMNDTECEELIRNTLAEGDFDSDGAKGPKNWPTPLNICL